MDAKDFIKLLDNPQDVENIPVDELKKLSLEYPYSQPVQLLYATRLSQSSEYLFSKQLAKTSILTDDRSVLFDLFERDREEIGSPTVINQPMETKEAEVQEEAPEKDALITQLEATIKPQPEPTEQIKPAPEETTPEPMETMPTPEQPAVAETPPAPATPELKEAPKPKLDLTGLSPKEKVQAILAENKRIREEMAGRKAATPVVTPAEPEIKPEPEIEENKAEVVEETPQEPVADQPAVIHHPPISEQDYNKPEVPEEVNEPEPTASVPEPVSEVPFDAPVASAITTEVAGEPQENPVEPTDPSEEEIVTEEPEKPFVFTIDEEKPEPVFSIEDDDYYVEPPKPVEEETSKEAPIEDPHDIKSEKHSLAEWLQLLRKKENDGVEPFADDDPVTDTRKLPPAKKLELMDAFVEKLPEIKKKNRYTPRADKPKINPGEYGGENDDMLVTETLAKVYISQKHYDKAIKAFEILKLKYPEKSSFFADQISEVRNLINSK